MKCFGKKELSNILGTMEILDIIMQPKENAWLRLVNSCRLNKGKKYVISNGAGDNLIVYITDNGTYIKGFDHESERNQFAAEEWDSNFFEQIYQDAPKEFLDLLEEEEKDETTFCMWNLGETDEWQENEIEESIENEEIEDDEIWEDGGKEYLLGYICKDAEQWYDQAKDYYETELDMEIIQKVYDGITVAEDDIKTLNPNRNVLEALAEISEVLV